MGAARRRGGIAVLRWFDQRSSFTRIAILGAVFALVVTVARRAATPIERPIDEVEALARVIRSEVGTASHQHRLHVAWAVRNLARERGQSIVALACSPCGPQQRGRPVSSRQRATGADRALARDVLAASCSLDPTDGATHFIDPVLQDRLARVAAPGYAGNPYEVVARRWRVRYGWEPYYRLGRTLEMWGPARRTRRSAPCVAG
jgi:hypothetical protein